MDSIQRLINEQDDEYYYITPQELIDVLELGSYSSGVLKPRNFDGKRLYVQGKLDLGGKPIKTLGNIAYVDGDLNIQNTNITDLGSTLVKGYVWDTGSPREKIRTRREELAKLSEADDRRNDGEWDLDNPNIDEEGLAANALFGHLVGENELTEMDDETKEQIKTKKEQYEEIQDRYSEIKDTASTEELDELEQEGVDLLNEIEDLQENVADVYYIMPQKYKPYGRLYSFEVVGMRDREYYVGTWDDMYESAIDNQLDLLYDIGLDSLNQLVEDNIDKSSVREYIEEFYESDIRDNPEVYFDEDDFELTEEQEERKEQLENYINEMEDLKTEKEEELEGTEDEDEITDLERKIEEIESNIESAQEELDSIEPDTEPTDDMIQDKINYYVRNTDEVYWLKEMGHDLSNWVDMRGVATDIVDSDGIGVLSGYNSDYDEYMVTTSDGKRHRFVIVRQN